MAPPSPSASILPFSRPEAALPPLHLSPPHLTGAELEALQDVLASGWLAPAGPTPLRFEAAVAEAMRQPHALAVSSGTAALGLSYRLLGVEPGDEVWTSSLTFLATIGPAVQMGATPRFLDVDPTSWTLDPALLAEELAAAARRGRLPRAVVPADLYGQPADIAAIAEACARWGVRVLSDSACGMGALQHGWPAGHGADLVAVSFNGNKIVTSTGGGALLAPDGAAIARARHLATQAKEPAPHYQHETTGFSCGLSALLAGFGLAQLPCLEERVSARRAIFARYAGALGALPGLSFMPEPGWARSTRWLTAMLVDPRRFGADREALRLALLEQGIESRPVWKPLHLQPVFRQAPAVGGAVAAALFEQGLCLPSGSAMTVEQQDRVIATIRALHRG
ncbi:DegT/DnrJ/EryC1/StrS family aminotransferase [Roseococcus pinisoli]|uniref:Aminotransferase class I/II-fold pyridoxal phosphate-dependent enzyme n=1 Tax=Roseococcus pinisoli TaxID=2835040 RepID=A0ABS5QAS1_9PROT|nr:aminotransferase class I/II-fold pyridoxal phosphate-dependent enzyme [Roseococcus pinisoli]MBS7810796.1 aminotransferase class I/II-fold pyridoxal phosphate-dependent enzyme [Roseococcus pinisoli]